MSSDPTKENQDTPKDVVPQETGGTGGTTTGTGGAATQGPAYFFGLLVYVFVGLIIAWQFPTAREFISRWWWAIAAAIVLFAGISFLGSIRGWFAKTTPKGRIGMFVFGVIPIVLFLFGLVVFVPERFQVPVLRVIFLVPVCFLPAIMYYLFMATKKNSVYNEYIMSLDKLGILAPRDNESEKERKNRVQTYQQRFEAVYGSLPTNLAGLVLVPAEEGRIESERRPSGTGPGTIAGIFIGETAVPVVLSTVLIGLGWLITLPPWPGTETKNGTTPQVQQTEQTNKRQSSGLRPATLLASLNSRETLRQLALLQSNEQAQPSQPPAEPKPQESEPQTKDKNGEEDAPRGLSPKWLGAFTPESTPVHFAFLGAYFFCLQMLFRRYVRRDLRASAYVAVALRIILAIIGIWVVVAAADALPKGEIKNAATYEKTLLVLGFVIGVFPRVAWQVIQVTTKRAFGLLVPNLRTELPVNDLDGLTVWHEARLEEEDIENIPNMATADIVDLLLNTRIPSDRIIDWIDQAILYTHLGRREEGSPDLRAILRGHGIRTASSLVEAYNTSDAHKDRELFEKILPAEEGTRSPMRSFVDALGTNPNLVMIQTWRGLSPHTHVKPPTATH
jgi:hypothetical protein